MKVYFAHPRHSFDYEKELYQPLRASALNSQHEFVLPHEKNADGVHSKEIIRSCDVFCAEVSQPATGVGIELGWADAVDVPVICFYKKGTKPSGSLKFIARETIEYSDSDELVEKLSESLQKI
jgi:hypothetical protein